MVATLTMGNRDKQTNVLRPTKFSMPQDLSNYKHTAESPSLNANKSNFTSVSGASLSPPSSSLARAKLREKQMAGGPARNVRKKIPVKEPKLLRKKDAVKKLEKDLTHTLSRSQWLEALTRLSLKVFSKETDLTQVSIHLCMHDTLHMMAVFLFSFKEDNNLTFMFVWCDLFIYYRRKSLNCY